MRLGGQQQDDHQEQLQQFQLSFTMPEENIEQQHNMSSNDYEADFPSDLINNASDFDEGDFEDDFLPDVVTCHDLDNDDDDDDDKEAPFCEWHRVGLELCEIASSFESRLVNISSQMTSSQRQVFNAYRRMKLSLLRRDKRQRVCGRSPGTSICRQIVLSGVWLLLKQIM